ncbi:hypothetical protein CEXT_373611 [Caerostris extrusa]|uniref:Uncharacterized protein n=1 Tax=Caerostris extrusa TaxID=172846 RepID=A0AAV4NF96_CAEEX|nr:hypothetical protein CEXT_373611 [Caerostris extrusa]
MVRYRICCPALPGQSSLQRYVMGLFGQSMFRRSVEPRITFPYLLGVCRNCVVYITFGESHATTPLG